MGLGDQASRSLHIRLHPVASGERNRPSRNSLEVNNQPSHLASALLLFVVLQNKLCLVVYALLNFVVLQAFFLFLGARGQ